MSRLRGEIMYAEIGQAEMQKTPGKDARFESELWSGIREEKEEALSELFYLYYQPLFNYGFNIVPSEDFIKDCIQDLFLTLWVRRKTINKAYSVASYLFSSMRRIVFRKLRKQKARYERNKKYVDDFFDDPVDVEALMIRFETDRERKRQLKQAVSSLGQRQKEAIYLKFYNGLSNNEIAEVMGIKRQSVYNHVSEAIQQLQGFVR